MAEAEEIEAQVANHPPAQLVGKEGLMEEEPVISISKLQMWTSPMHGCSYKHKALDDTSKSTRSARGLHLATCVERHVKQLRSEKKLWSTEQIREEIHGRINQAFLVREKKKWCPGSTCFVILAQTTRHHKKCGWNVMRLEKPVPWVPGDSRPSNLIEVREMVGPAAKDVDQDVPVQNLQIAMEVVKGGSLPSLTEVTLLPKFVYNPCNRPLHPSLGLLWTQALSFTIQLIMQTNGLVAAWSLWFMLAPCTLALTTDGKEGNSEWQVLASNRLRRWMQGEFLSLWIEAVIISNEHTLARKDQGSSDSEKEHAALRAKQLIQSGRFADAAKALLADQPVVLSPERIATLRDKFPLGENVFEHVDMSTAQRIKVEPSAVEASLQSFPRGSSAGLSRIWPESCFC